MLRYPAGLTISPATDPGMSGDIGLLAPRHLASIVLSKSQFFGRKGQFVLKAGYAAMRRDRRAQSPYRNARTAGPSGHT